MAAAVGIILAGIQYYYAKSKEDEPSIDNTVYTFVAGFALVYIIMYAIHDDRAEAILHMETGEPDF